MSRMYSTLMATALLLAALPTAAITPPEGKAALRDSGGCSECEYDSRFRHEMPRWPGRFY